MIFCCYKLAEYVPPTQYMYSDKIFVDKIILLHHDIIAKYFCVDWSEKGKVTVAYVGSPPQPHLENRIHSEEDVKFLKLHIDDMQLYDGDCNVWIDITSKDKLYLHIKQLLGSLYSAISYIKLNIIKYDYQEILKATQNFSAKIATGGFGEVYIGILRNTEVAVKRMINPDKIILESFYRKLNILSMVRHPRVIQLLGICLYDQTEPILVFEYMCNGSLTDKLEALSENKIMNICLQIAHYR